MALILRQATIVESPDPTVGGSGAFTASNATSGSGSASASSSNGGAADSETKSCRWRNFGSPVAGQIIKVELKYDWNWSSEAHASVSDQGSASANAGASGNDFSGGSSASVNGPGPVNDDDSDNDNGSVIAVLANNTDLSIVQLQAEVTADAESGVVGSDGAANSQAGVSISNLRIEITTLEANPIVIM